MNTIPWQEFSQTLAGITSLEMLPLSGAFELTPLCNFRCKMCYVRLDPGQMSKIGRERTADEWISLGRQAADMGCLSLLLTGGEPFLHPDIRRIYEALINMGFLITIYSNASLITDEIVQWLSKSPPKLIRVTLYGACNETYEKVCGDPQGYDHAVRGIRLLQNAGLPLTLTSTLINENESDLDSMMAFAEQHQLLFCSTAAVNPPVRGAESSACASRFCDEKVRAIVKNMPVSTYSCFSPDSDPLSRCKNIKNGFWVTWDGRLTVCSMTTEPFTEPFKTDFKTAWYALRKTISQIKPPEECVNCKYLRNCQSCIGAFCSETGSPSKTNDRICNVAKARYEYSSILKNN